MKFIPLVTRIFEKTVTYCLPLAKLLSLYYKPIVKREIRLGKIEQHDRVLFIGGGALPFTAIEIYKQTGASVHVIDCDINAVWLAKKTLKLLHIEKNVTVSHADGVNTTLKNFTVVHIAQQAFPKEKILRHLTNHGRSNLRILVRCPKKLLTCFYSASCSINDECFYRSSQTCRTANKTLLYVNPHKEKAGEIM
ncbi:nicotianamine synthase family protein [Evansella cellulosilytica]|uniref:Nicotianamine synthase n=1 Tax=Evansella cellulosilytica (strain ATCC 21833 / DSM 2522 / FERM P-1141 / JCM 9156 / N-4) TaxID=649639 RepID=E6TW87_EVAC2|nr:nicotianamine synthase family protein [Evansella cellulosilytica]ADU31043.1 hypothetical protein Bcell_2789 [Evansella cellulosilytica DSM 2522]